MATGTIKLRETGRIRRFGTVGNNKWLCVSLPIANTYSVTQVRIFGGAVLSESDTDGYTVNQSNPDYGQLGLVFHGNAFTDCYNNQYNILVIVDVS